MTRFAVRLLCVVVLLWSMVGVAYAQGPGNNRVPRGTVATASTNCGEPTAGSVTLCLIEDGNATDDCTTGGGSTEVLCWYDGSSWQSVSTTVSSGGSLTISAATPAVIYQDSDNTDTQTNASATVNCTDTGSGTEDCDYTIAVNNAGTNRDVLTIDGDDEVSVRPLVGDFQVQNFASGNVDLSLRDYADTTDDDMSHGTLRSNCTATGSGAEDCDVSILVTEGGAAIEARFVIDADSGVDIGSANTNDFTVTTDGTGNAEVVLPNESIGTAEILNDTITFANISDSSAVDADTTFTQGDGITVEFAASHTSGDVDGFLLDFNQADDGAATDDAVVLGLDVTSESGDAGDTLTGIRIEYENGTANTIMDAAIAIDNEETTASTMTDAIIVTSSGVDAGVVDGLDVSASNITNAVNIGVNPIAGGNSDSFTAGATDATFSYTRDDSGSVTFTCADDDANATCIYDSGGTGNVQVGTADTAVVTIQTDDTGDGTDLVLPAQGVNGSEVLNDTLDFTQFSDTLALDADTDIALGDGETLSITPSHTDGDIDAVLIDFNQVDDGDATDDSVVFGIDATSESGDTGDTLRLVHLQYEDGTANTVLDAAILIDNAEDTASTMTDAIIITSTGVDDGVVDAIDASASNITNALNAGSNLIVGGNDESITIGATDSTLTLTTDGTETAVFTGADAAGASNTTYDTTGAGAIVVGSADVTAVTITTDDTGDGTDLVLPADGVDASELNDAMCTGVIAEAFDPTETGATNDYLNLTDGTFSSTETDEDEFTIPVAMLVNNLYAEVDVAPGAGNDAWTITIREDAGDTAVTCQIDETATTCTDTSNTDAIAAGAKLTVEVDSSGGGADPDAAAEMLISFCVSPD